MDTYQEEPWRATCGELIPHLVASWREVEAQDVPGMVLDPDFARYDALADAGMLQVVTVRNGGSLLGYHVSLLAPHLHYRGQLSAATDTFYVPPGARQGWRAVRLMRLVETRWQQKGVQVATTMSKLAPRNCGVVFARLGWHASEQLYVKRLGGGVWA